MSSIIADSGTWRTRVVWRGVRTETANPYHLNGPISGWAGNEYKSHQRARKRKVPCGHLESWVGGVGLGSLS